MIISEEQLFEEMIANRAAKSAEDLEREMAFRAAYLRFSAALMLLQSALEATDQLRAAGKSQDREKTLLEDREMIGRWAVASPVLRKAAELLSREGDMLLQSARAALSLH
jgi:hypothetical protein